MFKHYGQRVFGWWQKGKISLLVLTALLVMRLQGKSLTVIWRLTGLGDVIWSIVLGWQVKQQETNTGVMLVCGSPFHRLVNPKHCLGIDWVIGLCPLIGISPRLIKLWAGCGVKVLNPACWDNSGRIGEEIHLIEEFQDSTGLPRAVIQPHITISDCEKLDVIRSFGIVNSQFTVLLHTGRTWAVRELEQRVWQEVVDAFARKFNWRILHVCQPRIIQPLAPAFVLNGVENLSNDYPLPVIAALLSVCNLFVGIDSGLLHVAGAVGTPVVGIFGSTKPELRLPAAGKNLGISQRQDCSYCQHYSPLQHWCSGCPQDIKCMKSLSAEYICGEIERFFTTTIKSKEKI